MNADFKELLLLAQAEDEESFMRLFEMYKPLLLRESVVNGIVDEDLYQEYCIIFLKCVRKITAFPKNKLCHNKDPE